LSPPQSDFPGKSMEEVEKSESGNPRRKKTMKIAARENLSGQ
jgi:hypothetical protein